MIKATAARPVNAALDFARETFRRRGSDCLDLTMITAAIPWIAADKIPELPFTEEELKRARALDQYLVLELTHTVDGQPLTPKGLYEKLQNKTGAGKLLNDVGWYEAQGFFAEPIALLPTWRLVGRSVIPGSVGCDYLAQTDAIATYLRDEVYVGEELPGVYAAAIAEFEERRDQIKSLVRSDWQEEATQLAALKLNQLFRQTPGQVIYSLAVYKEVNGEHLFPDAWIWTNSCHSKGGLVSVGGFDSEGAYVNGWKPDYLDGILGVCFSRSGVPPEV